MTSFDSNDLPDFRAWRQGFEPQPDANAYLAQHLSITEAMLFAELMVPDLVLVRGCVILRSRYDPANFEQWWSRAAGETAAVERALNHLHLWDLFDPASAVEERALDSLAVRIARCRALHAEHEFPEHIFTTDVTDEYGPTVIISSAG